MFSDRKIAARCPRCSRDQVKCRQSPDYHDFTISSVFSATDQPTTRSALLTPNWRGCEGKVRRNPVSGSRHLPYCSAFISIIRARLLVPAKSISRLHSPSHHPQPPLEIAPINSMIEVFLCARHQQVSKRCRDPVHQATALTLPHRIPRSWQSYAPRFRPVGALTRIAANDDGHRCGTLARRRGD